MQQKAVRFKAEAVAEDGTFEGYASVFGNKDLGGDIVQPGAFKRTIDHHGGKFPLLVDHQFTMAARAGIVEAREDEKGLRVKGYLNLDKQLGREVYSDLKQANEHGVELGMSFGYEAPKSKYDKERDARLLQEIKLYEVTLTQIPMNPAAGVTSVKDALERANLTPQQATTLIEHLKALLEADSGDAHSDEGHAEGSDPSADALALSDGLLKSIDTLTQKLSDQ